MNQAPLSASVRREIDYYLSLDESALLAVMGGNKPLFAFGETTQPWELGLAWFEHAEVLFYGRLCIQDPVGARLSQTGLPDDASLVLSVADAICAYITNIPPLAVAAYIVKRGIERFCRRGSEIEDSRRTHLLAHAVRWYATLSGQLEQAGRDLAASAELEAKRRLSYSVVRALYTDKYERLLRAYRVPVP